MKKLAIALLFCGASAFAATVTYTTTGLFGSDSLATISTGGMTITYTPVNPADSVTSPSFANVGQFTITGSSSGTFSDTFTLTINQTVPTIGNSSTSSSITGTVTGSSSGISLSFVPTTFNIGTASWQFFNTPLSPPSTNNGVTTVEAFVSVAPEPISLSLMGGGLALIGLFARRRIAK